jgi:hypothetical protein
MSTSALIPVKTTVVDMLKGRVELVTGLTRVIHRPSIPIDRDNTVFPVAFTFDDTETNAVGRNRVRTASFPYVVEVYDDRGQEIVSKNMDVVQADLFKILISEPTDDMRKYGIRVTEGGTPIDKFYADDNMSGAIFNYIVEYRTDFNSLYSITY